MLVEALAGDRADALLRALPAAVASDGRMAWERDLLAAFDEGEPRQRDALVNEQLLELEGRLARFSRVPRVCASIATSAGLLFGSLALLQGLGSAEGDASGSQAALSSALGAVSV